MTKEQAEEHLQRMPHHSVTQADPEDTGSYVCERCAAGWPMVTAVRRVEVR